MSATPVHRRAMRGNADWGVTLPYLTLLTSQQTNKNNKTYSKPFSTICYFAISQKSSQFISKYCYTTFNLFSLHHWQLMQCGFTCYMLFQFHTQAKSTSNKKISKVSFHRISSRKHLCNDVTYLLGTGNKLIQLITQRFQQTFPLFILTTKTCQHDWQERLVTQQWRTTKKPRRH